MVLNFKGYEVFIDDEDYPKVSRYKWHPRTNAHKKHPEQVYFSYHCTQGRMMLHRYVLGLSINDGKIVDHINGNTLDNRKSNLRVVTSSQNNFNRHLNMNSKTGYKGVDFHNQSKRFRARISIHGKTMDLGFYSTAEDAAEAYKEGSKRFHGEYGKVK